MRGLKKIFSRCKRCFSDILYNATSKSINQPIWSFFETTNPMRNAVFITTTWKCIMFAKLFWVWDKSWSFFWLKEGRDLTWYLTQATHFINAGDYRYKTAREKLSYYVGKRRHSKVVAYIMCRLKNWKKPWSRSLVSLDSLEQKLRRVEEGEWRRKNRFNVDLIHQIPLR